MMHELKFNPEDFYNQANMILNFNADCLLSQFFNELQLIEHAMFLARTFTFLSFYKIWFGNMTKSYFEGKHI